MGTETKLCGQLGIMDAAMCVFGAVGCAVLFCFNFYAGSVFIRFHAFSFE